MKWGAWLSLLAGVACAENVLVEKTYAGMRHTLLRDENTAAHIVVSDDAEVMQQVLVGFAALDSAAFVEFAPQTAGTAKRLVEQSGPPTSFSTAGTAVNGVEVNVAVLAPSKISESIFGGMHTVRDYVERDLVHKGPLGFTYEMYGEGGERIKGTEKGLKEITFVRKFFSPDDEVTFTLKSGDVTFDISDKNEDTATPFDIGLWHVNLNPPAGKSGTVLVRATINVPPPQSMVLSNIIKDDKILEHSLIDDLMYLTTTDGLMSGSWQHMTYSGRDSLVTAYMMFDTLSLDVVENVVVSTLDRIASSTTTYTAWPSDWSGDRDSRGFVCNEEIVGDYANWNNGEHITNKRHAVCDYKHADVDFLFLPLFAKFAQAAPVKAKSLMAKTSSSPYNNGKTYEALLKENVASVLRQTTRYSAHPSFKNLIRIRDEKVGNWRDTPNGLAGAVYPLDVNTAYAPAALVAIVELAPLGLTTADDKATASSYYKTWGTQEHFHNFEVRVERNGTKLNEQLADYVLNASSCPECVNLLNKTQSSPDRFLGVGLYADGNPAPLLTSDYGAIFTYRTTEDVATKFVDQATSAVRQKWPRGLMTDAGLLSASPAYMWNYNGTETLNEMAKSLDQSARHGTNVHGWQQMMMHHGLKSFYDTFVMGMYENTRISYPDAALQSLWAVVPNWNETHAPADLWSFKFDTAKNGIVPVPFAQGRQISTPINLLSMSLIGPEKTNPLIWATSGAARAILGSLAAVALAAAAFL